MSNGSVPLTIIGNTTDIPELRFTAQGIPVVNFTIASTEKVWDKQAGEMKDGSAVFMRCTAWRDMAENIAGSLGKGVRVIAQGKLRQRSYENRDGVKQTVTELDVDAIGADLRWATAQVTRASRPEGGQADRGRVETATGDGWATQEPGGAQDAWEGASDVPF
jgi:single-strand DNA-binding protein